MWRKRTTGKAPAGKTSGVESAKTPEVKEAGVEEKRNVGD